jgi:hypothetical protein
VSRSLWTDDAILYARENQNKPPPI